MDLLILRIKWSTTTCDQPDFFSPTKGGEHPGRYISQAAVTFDTKRGETKEKKLDELRKAASNEVKSVIKYHISLPTEEAHHTTHQTRGPHLMAQREKISELVQDDTQEVRKDMFEQFCVLKILLIHIFQLIGT